MRVMHKTVLTDLQYEGTTPKLEFDVVDADGVAFRPEEMYMTLRDGATDVVVNGRLNVDVIARVDNNGHFLLYFDPADLTFLDSTNHTELRRALFIWKWAAGTRVGAELIEFPIENDASLPAA